MEDMALGIAFAALCKILGSAAVTREGIQAIVRQTATQLRTTERVVVRLHAVDLALLHEHGALDATLPSGGAVSWVADSAVVLGGCVIASDGGELDARLETQIERLRTALVAARSQTAAPSLAMATERRKTGRRVLTDSTHFTPERRKHARRNG